MEDPDYTGIFRDVCVGSSFVKSSLGDCYLKHFNVFDQSSIDKKHAEYLKEAQERGLPTIKEALSSLYEEGFWSEKDEALISQEELFLQKISNQKKTTYLKSQIDSFNVQIEQCLKRLNALRNKRNSLLGNTCENFADQRITEEFIKICLFKDEECRNRMFSDEEFDDIEVEKLYELVKFFNNLTKDFCDLNLQKLVLQDFFSYYMPHCEDPYRFFGKPATLLSVNQLKLLLFAQYFKNVLSYSEDIPDEYRRDPEKIIDFVNANKKAKDFISKSEKEGSAQSIVGATSEDYKYLNMNKGNVKSLSLAEEARKKGGSLDMKDLMQLMGN